MFDYDRFGAAFLDMRLHRLRCLITTQTDALVAERGIRVPSPCFSVVVFLQDHPDATLTLLSNELGYSPQLIAQRVAQLETARLLKRKPDTRDRRRMLVSLTASGRRQARKVAQLMPMIATAYEELFRTMQCDLNQAVRDFDSLLRNRPLVQRQPTKQETR